jgi:hypothetical protein
MLQRGEPKLRDTLGGGPEDRGSGYFYVACSESLRHAVCRPLEVLRCGSCRSYPRNWTLAVSFREPSQTCIRGEGCPGQ